MSDWEKTARELLVQRDEARAEVERLKAELEAVQAKFQFMVDAAHLKLSDRVPTKTKED